MGGKELRLKQLFRHSDKTFILPMDHGITLGPVDGIRDICPVIQEVRDTIDAVVLHKGLASQITRYIDPASCGLIVHLSASTVLSPDSNRKELVTSVEHAIKMGAIGVSVHINLGNDFEAQMLKDFGSTSEQCAIWGMPLIAMMYVRDGSGKGENDSGKIKHAARVAEELGADIVKVNYTGTMDTFSDVVRSVKIPVVIAGGDRNTSDVDFLIMVNEAVKAGARGVAIGRNLFQHSNPAALAHKVRQILNSNMTSEQFVKFINEKEVALNEL